MNFLNTVTDIARGIGNILLPGQPFAKTQPISTVSSKPVEIGITDTQTRTIYEPLTPLAVLASPAPYTYNETIKKSIEALPGFSLSPNQAIITTNPVSSGAQGNIWDVLKKGAQTVIDTGFNVLTSKLNDWASGKKVETAYATNQTATKSISNPSALMQFLNPTIQPAVSDGIKQGIISVAGKPPTWIWFALAGLGVIILLPKLRR